MSRSPVARRVPARVRRFVAGVRGLIQSMALVLSGWSAVRRRHATLAELVFEVVNGCPRVAGARVGEYVRLSCGYRGAGVDVWSNVRHGWASSHRLSRICANATLVLNGCYVPYHRSLADRLVSD